MHEILPDPDQDETQKSWNTSNINGSQTSSEDENYQNDISDGEHEMLPQAQRTNSATESAAIDATPSKNMYGDDCGEQGTFTKVGPTSNLSEVDSGPTHSISAQDVRSSAESEAQSLRRRASLEEDKGSGRKRARLQDGYTDFLPQISSVELVTPEADEASQPAIASVPRVSYYDTHDGVHRCEACGWEVWRPSGVCTGCGAGEPAYYEVIDDKEGSSEDANAKPKSRNHNRYPRIYLSSNAAEEGGANDIKAEEGTDATGHYLDGASAYDSASNVAEDEYEWNSFIDDSLVDIGNNEDTDGSTSDDTDYKARYEQLLSAHSNLEQEHDDLINDHEAFRRDVLGSDYEDSEDTDEPQFDIVDIQVQDPPVSEIVLSHVQGDSQSSVISSRRLRTRVDAFLAAPEDWHNISLMSTGDNHTEEELEL
jgi:hypothetical protein